MISGFSPIRVLRYRVMRREFLRVCRRLWSSLSTERVLQALEERGLVNQCTKVGLLQHSPGSAVYVGFDPTADSLHTGNLMAIMALLHFRHAGYQPIAVVGGATGIVGDPSGRLNERDVLPREALERNVAGISENLTRIFENEEQLYCRGNQPKLKILNNAEWWDGVSAVEFVSEIARHFRLSAMLGKESVRTRLQTEEGMSCAEFLYPTFQAYDFLHLHRHHNCWMQLGGGDQWGNITSGCDFIRKATGKIVHGLTLPLLTTESGEKLGKSMGNAVWLAGEKTSSYELYQHFVRTADQEVEMYLKYFTLLSVEEIQRTMREHEVCPEKFAAQKCVAEHVTRLVHGDSGLQQALKATAVLFGDASALPKLSGQELEQLFSDAPSTELPLHLLALGELTVGEMAVRAGAVPSTYFARNLVKAGGLYLNSIRATSAEALVSKDRHLLAGGITVVRVGKKNYRLIKWK